MERCNFGAQLLLGGADGAAAIAASSPEGAGATPLPPAPRPPMKVAMSQLAPPARDPTTPLPNP
jgi:hypothetical protein